MQRDIGETHPTPSRKFHEKTSKREHVHSGCGNANRHFGRAPGSKCGPCTGNLGGLLTCPLGAPLGQTDIGDFDPRKLPRGSVFHYQDVVTLQIHVHDAVRMQVAQRTADLIQYRPLLAFVRLFDRQPLGQTSRTELQEYPKCWLHRNPQNMANILMLLVGQQGQSGDLPPHSSKIGTSPRLACHWNAPASSKSHLTERPSAEDPGGFFALGCNFECVPRPQFTLLLDASDILGAVCCNLKFHYTSGPALRHHPNPSIHSLPAL
mmetsp:Transcript_115302/g.264814  ORF Transcript_115302/g.264814 Transcript_115302/m.264814 type:complete len:264 (+) Transcript_115302:271-1062(+)